ncbi:MAG: hypothetical protein AAF495_11575 [Pseudomonadota bacterium]
MKHLILAISLLMSGLMFLAFGANGGEARAQSDTEAGADGHIGIWERRFQDSVGQKYLEVLELYPDRRYVKHGWAEDRGRYQVEGNQIGFRSDVNDRHTRDVEFEQTDDDRLKLVVTFPFRMEEEWQRSTLTPNFRTIEIDGRHVPRALSGLMGAALISEALPWRADALPTWVRVEERQNGHYTVIFHFYSPSTVEEMRIRLSAYDIKRSTNDGSRTVTAALPPNFMDLPLIVSAAKRDGIAGALKKADLLSYEGYGAVWGLSTTARQGGYFAGETGERIRADVTGYVAQYNEDWRRINDQWRALLRQLAPKPQSSFSSFDSFGSGSSGNSGSGSSSSGPTYDTGSQNAWGADDPGAYGRFQNGTPTADDCYRYGC